MKTQQRGGTVIGLIIGMIVGLAAALAVAVYVTKVPVPFLSKGGKTADQDAAEAQRNKNWDPNAPLQGKNPAPSSFCLSCSASSRLVNGPT
ncbi:sporulation protein, partial [Delftia sp. SD018]|nr:sporulation protein [Delftia sp. SD018]